VLVDDREVDRRGAGRCNRDREAKQVRRCGETTCADADGDERNSEERYGQCQESVASIERFHLFLTFVADMDGVLVVACTGCPVMLGRNCEDTEDGRDYRQEDSKRDEEPLRTDRAAGSRARRGAAPDCPPSLYGMFGHSAG